MKAAAIKASDETAVTEITIGPDGRIYVFGLSREVLTVLADLWPGNLEVEERLARLPRVEQRASAAPATGAGGNEQGALS